MQNAQPDSYKICPQCQTPANLNATSCVNCGRQYRTQFVPPDQTQTITPQTPSWVRSTNTDNNNPSHPTVIVLMWLFTLCSFYSYSTTTIHINAAILDSSAVACMVALFMSNNETDKTHAKVKLAFAIISAIFAFLTGSAPYHG